MDWDIQPLTAQHHTLYEIIADSLEEMILTDKVDSQCLPTEHELAAKFGVSRTVVREALKLLRERGLVKMRAGDGAYTTRPRSSTMSPAMNRLIRFNDLTDWDVVQIRIILECAACELAFEHVGENELQELTVILNDMIQFKSNLDIRVKKDCEFHYAIARFSQNALLAFFVQSINDILYDFMRKRIEYRPTGNDEGIVWHTRLIECFRTADANAVSNLMREHILSSYHQMEYEEDGAKPVIGKLP